MSTYLAKLKQLENEKNSHYVPDTLPPKPPKATYAGFDGTGAGRIEKKITDSKTPKPETLQDRQREARAEWRRQKAIAMLEKSPDTKRAIYTDTDSDPHNVILAIAVRACQQTCEMLIPKDKYDPWRLLELIERLGQTTH